MRHPNVIKIGEACEILGIHPNTLRRWEAEGKIVPLVRTRGTGTRYYNREEIIAMASPKDDATSFATIEEIAAEYGMDPEVLETCRWALGVARYDKRVVDGQKAELLDFIAKQREGDLE